MLTTARRYLSATLNNETPDAAQRTALRSAVGRIIVRRSEGQNVVFCPDGPLTEPEVGMLRAETFTPTLVGMLPSKPVEVGDDWEIQAPAASELTNISPIQSGRLVAVLREIKQSPDGAIARVTFAGSLTGPSDYGLTRDTLDGQFHFDLDHRMITHVLLNATRDVLDGDGRVIGHVEGRHELTRRPAIDDPKLADAALASLDLKPSPQTTRLLFEEDKLAVRFVYPRNWELVSVSKNIVHLREPTGGHMRVSVDPSPTPKAEKLRQQLIDWLRGQKASDEQVGLVTQMPPSGATTVERFSARANIASKSNKAFEWTYVLLRRQDRSAVLDASLAAERVEVLRGDIDFVAGTIEFLPKP